ncbi:3',5'-cyclic AMP phosphodiesterase CpdA [Microbacterium resistens]|uniref:3',5'-cyclic AMP phosphodiesterase CpdA n=1 Tax=Microbacterium resistens TaxID=156977 RepID=A0ABU1S820_9MICO|nr:metallophosphoesterase [Microbacterium resistens]MDR6865750.1 3',5'-cyclic AMP phosphodiesterase CpdA [Microbacterium resistens]
MVRIAHLSDTHLDGTPERALRAQRVLHEITELDDIDLVLVSGDLTDHAAHAEYVQFFDIFSAFSPLLVVPGNHDRRTPLAAHLEPAADGYFNTVSTVDGLTVIGLDSLIEGETAGRLAEGTIEFAHDALRSADGPAILALHHPPVPVGHDFADQNGLLNASALAEILTMHDHVIAILTGHVHTALAASFAGRPLLGAPGIASTMRLGSRMDPIADTNAMPGLAVHTVEHSASESTSIRSIFHYLSPDTP